MRDDRPIDPNAVYAPAMAAELLHVSPKQLARLPVKRAKLGRRTVRYQGAWLLDYLRKVAA